MENFQLLLCFEFVWTLCSFQDLYFSSNLKISTCDLRNLFNLLLNSKIINFVKDKQQSTFVGYFFVILMFSCAFMQTICNNNVQTRLLMVSSRVSSACMGLIYRKVSFSHNSSQLSLFFYNFLNQGYGVIIISKTTINNW